MKVYGAGMVKRFVHYFVCNSYLPNTTPLQAHDYIKGLGAQARILTDGHPTSALAKDILRVTGYLEDCMYVSLKSASVSITF